MSERVLRPEPPCLPDEARPRGSRVAQRIHAGVFLVVPTVAAILGAYELWSGAAPAWGVALALVGYVICMSGITAGYHRLLAHQAYRTHRVTRIVLAVLGSMAAQGPPLYWVSNHRRHHRYVEGGNDPHSPNAASARARGRWRGFLHSHIGWTFTHQLTNTTVFARDLLQDRDIAWVNRHYYIWVLLGLAAPAAFGAWHTHSVGGAYEGLLWGGGVRLFISYHMTSSINSITHMFGYRNFATACQSRNNLWLGIPTLGEAWHNNHHAYPACAVFGSRWWEIDLGGAMIRLLQALGLAWQVRRIPATASHRPSGEGPD